MFARIERKELVPQLVLKWGTKNKSELHVFWYGIWIQISDNKSGHTIL